MEIVPFSDNLSVVEFRAVKIVRTNEHVDGGWFWSKYSTNPYTGCQFGCKYCFLRQEGYGLSENQFQNSKISDSFSQIVKVAVNAPELLDKELGHLPKDVIIVGDYQPIENKYCLSRKMLEVCYKHNFPVVVIVKSPLVVRDRDIIKKIADNVGAVVIFSIASHTLDNYKDFFEPSTSSIESRFLAMKKNK